MKKKPAVRQDRTKILYVRGVPEDTRRKLKAWCAMKGCTIAEGLILLIERNCHK